MYIKKYTYTHKNRDSQTDWLQEFGSCNYARLANPKSAKTDQYARDLSLCKLQSPMAIYCRIISYSKEVSVLNCSDLQLDKVKSHYRGQSALLKV